MDEEFIDLALNDEIPDIVFYSFVVLNVLGTISFLYFNLFKKR